MREKLEDGGEEAKKQLGRAQAVNSQGAWQGSVALDPALPCAVQVPSPCRGAFHFSGAFDSRALASGGVFQSVSAAVVRC